MRTQHTLLDMFLAAFHIFMQLPARVTRHSVSMRVRPCAPGCDLTALEHMTNTSSTHHAPLGERRVRGLAAAPVKALSS
jgi:hypothetical protein